MARRNRPEGENFRYELIDDDGVRRKGTLTAADRSAALTTLVSQGHSVIAVDPQGGSKYNPDIGMMLRGGRPKRWKITQIASFARRLHQLLRAGLPVGQALVALAEASGAAQQAVVADIAAQVNSGTPFAEALAAHPHAFDDVFCAYISTAEASGTLPETTDRLARMLEQRASIERKIKAVTIYPKLVSGFIAIAVLGVIMFLVPKFAELYGQFNAELPAPTRALQALSSIMSPIHIKFSISEFPPVGLAEGHTFPFTTPINFASPLLWGLVLFFGARAFIRANANNPGISLPLNRLRFRLPIFGKLNRQMALYRWSSTLSGALRAGVRLEPGLDLAGAASGSAWYRTVSAEISDGVAAGTPLSQLVLGEPLLFPPDLVAMIVTGERAGELEDMLESVAVTTGEDIETNVATLGSKIEVALLILMGVTVGGLLVILYLPVLNLMNAVTEGYGL